MKKFLLILILFLSSSLFLTAHEFWLHPNKFIFKTGDLINVQFLVGENYEGENWSGNNKSIKSLQLHLPNVTDDLSDRISDSTGGSLQFAIYEEGTYLLSYNSTNKFIELEPKKFLEYLTEDGLQNAIDYRAANNETDSTGREYYQRSVKTIFQVGAKKTSLYKKQTNLPVDIIPLQNPYDLTESNPRPVLTAKILFQKKLLANQLVIVWHRLNNKTSKQEYTTDALGQVSFPVTPNGRWMISTVKMERIANDPKAQWQSYWGTCTWGYETGNEN